MTYNTIKNEIFNFYNEKGKYPQKIKLNKDTFIRLKETGHINLSVVNPSKVTLLGIEVMEDRGVQQYELY
ncbi:hypothetical protein [Bacillus testis]|uniref:hypothetical protein n=1 Tax=Bacillus testis TaxID=1622072 RepID=UPI00067F2BEE|nr:hypothetical protein [Bacillus testis]